MDPASVTRANRPSARNDQSSRPADKNSDAAIDSLAGAPRDSAPAILGHETEPINQSGTKADSFTDAEVLLFAAYSDPASISNDVAHNVTIGCEVFSIVPDFIIALSYTRLVFDPGILSSSIYHVSDYDNAAIVIVPIATAGHILAPTEAYVSSPAKIGLEGMMMYTTDIISDQSISHSHIRIVFDLGLSLKMSPTVIQQLAEPTAEPTAREF